MEDINGIKDDVMLVENNNTTVTEKKRKKRKKKLQIQTFLKKIQRRVKKKAKKMN